MSPQTFKYVTMGFAILTTLGGCALILRRALRTFGGTLLAARPNRELPVLTGPACVVSKRREEAGRTGIGPSGVIHYVTFETEDGKRHEFWLPADDYARLTNGDTGALSLLGAANKGFEAKHES